MDGRIWMRAVESHLDLSEEIDRGEMLTERQDAIARALVLRTPIKQIAADLEIAPSTVNDHIKALKRKLGARTTTELVANLLGQSPSLAPSNWGETKNRLPEAWAGGESSGRDHEGSYLLSDSAGLPIGGPWRPWSEPQVVPEELDGPESLVPRLLAIGKLVLQILAALILAVLAQQVVMGIIEQGGASFG